MTTVHAYAVHEAKGRLQPFEYELGELGHDEVDIEVKYCGVCHSDVAMIDNEWGFSRYPVVPGHEVIGVVAAIGEDVTRVKIGDTVGLGWFSRSCEVCPSCMGGDHNLCVGQNESTIVGRFGGFADRVRCQELWAVPIPDGLDITKAGPLFCGGATVFGPILEMGVRPTDRVGVIGIGGLGHLALQFLNAWGCHVTAFTSTEAKMEEAKTMGAHDCVSSRDKDAIGSAGKLDFILSTVTADLDWGAYLGALAPKGRLHVVGAPPKPLSVSAFSLLGGQRSVSGSPLASPNAIKKMLEFCTRHTIAPVTEHYKMSDVNDALEHLHAGKARYRLVLEA